MSILKHVGSSVAILVLFLMAGCAAPTAVPQPLVRQSLVSQPSGDATDTSMKDMIVIALNDPVTSLSPYLSHNQGEAFAAPLIYEPLKELLANNPPPIVTEGDTLTITLKLQPNRTFSDGTLVDGRSLLAGWPGDHADTGPEIPCPRSTPFPKGPQPRLQTEEGDPSEIVLTAQAPQGVDVREYAAQWVDALLAQPVMKTGIDGRKYGTGPFSVGRVDAGGFVLEASREYPGNRDRPEIRNIRFTTDASGADYALGQGTFGGLDSRKVYSSSVALSEALYAQGICPDCIIVSAPVCPTPTR